MTDLPDGWKTKNVGELAETQLGKMLNKGKQTGNHRKPYLRTDNVHWGFFDLSELKEMDISPEEEDKFLATKGDLVMCEGGASGRTAIWNYDYDIGFQNHIHRIRPKDVNEISTKYLLHYFEWFIRNGFAKELIKGVTISSLSQSGLRSIKIQYPLLPEQHKIIEFLEDQLSRLDAALADVKQAKVKAAQFRRSLLQAAFTGNLKSDGTRLMTSDTEVWLQSELRDLVEVLDKERIPVNSSERSKRVGDIPYYGATGQVGTIDKAIFDEELLILGEDGVQFFDPYKPKAYRISGPSWVNNHAHVLRPIRGKVNFYFLLHYLNHFNYAGYANGTTRLKLTQGAMNQIPVPLPPLPEQHKIVEFLEDHLSRLDAAIASADVMEKQSAGLRRSLLQAAFTGQLTKEVASV